MTAQHTPGPWRYVKLAVDENYMLVFCGSDCDNLRGYCGEANARLIAASPELLEALILMVRTHDEPAATLLQEMKEQKWLEKARAAILKATGGHT
jgi:hypothetical protein